MTSMFSFSNLTTQASPSRWARLLLPAICLMVLAVTPAAAATWTGAGADNNWNTSLNWQGGILPTADDAVVFPAAAARKSNVNNIGPFAWNSIAIDGEYTITSTHAITTKTINVSANATLAFPLVIKTDDILTITQTTALMTLTLTGNIHGTTDASEVNLAGPGIIEFTGAQANTYTGLTTVATTDEGYVRLARTAESIPGNLTITATGEVKIQAGSSQIHHASLVTILPGGELNISQATGLDSGVDNETIGALTGGGLVILGDRKLGCFFAPLNSNFSGTIEGTVSSSFRKHGSYIQKLSGASGVGFAGTTVLNGSSLTILGNQPSSNITATAGTLRLAHNASVGSITMTGTSNLAIGNEVNENQATSKSLSLTSTTRMDVFSGSTSGHSMLTVVGNVALGNATLTVNTDTAPPTALTEIVIIKNNGTNGISGTFAELPEGATVISSGVATPVAFTISYIGGTGLKDVVLTAVGPHTTGSPAITSASTATGTVGTPFSYQITTSPNNATSFTASNFPSELAFNTTTGVISGTPTTAQDKSVLLTATNGVGTASGTVTITISGTGPGPAGGNPLPPGPASTSNGGGSDGGCGLGATGLALIMLFGLTLGGTSNRQRR